PVPQRPEHSPHGPALLPLAPAAVGGGVAFVGVFRLGRGLGGGSGGVLGTRGLGGRSGRGGLSRRGGRRRTRVRPDGAGADLGGTGFHGHGRHRGEGGGAGSA